MALPKTLQQEIHNIMDPPGKNRDVEETFFQLANDPDCGDIVHLGMFMDLTFEEVLAMGRNKLCDRVMYSLFFLTGEIKR